MFNAFISNLAQTFWLEPQGSTSAARHDVVFHTILYVTGFFFLLVVTLMLTFIVLYRRRKGVVQEKGPTHNTALEIVWTIVPLGVVTVLFVMGIRAYLHFDALPDAAVADVVDVQAKQWSFWFNYPNGAESEKLYLRVDRPVILRLRSADVLHSLYIPAFRVQRNAVPNREVEMGFRPTREGTYHVFCTQYCGNGHSQMTTEACVVDEATYAARLAELSNIFVDPKTKEPRALAVVGKELYRTVGCANCHSVDGTTMTGPTWLGLYKRDHEFSLAPGGYSLMALDDDAKWNAYMRQHILTPGETVVKGYPPTAMPPYATQFSGTAYKEKKLSAIMEYIKSLDNHGPGGSPRYYRPMSASASSTAPGSEPATEKR